MSETFLKSKLHTERKEVDATGIEILFAIILLAHQMKLKRETRVWMYFQREMVVSAIAFCYVRF